MKSVSETRIGTMQALELFAEMALERAHRDDDLRPLAVISEAWAIQGYAPSALVDCLPYQPLRSTDDRLDLVEKARRGRPRRLLRADARGVLFALELALAGGLFTGPLASEAMRLRWLERGGHEHR